MSSSSEAALKARFDKLVKVATPLQGDPSKLLAQLKKAHALLTTHKSHSAPSFPPKLAQLGALLASTLVPLLEALPSEGLAFLAALVEHILKMVSKLWSGESETGRFGKGREELGVAWEALLEGVLRGMKLFLRDDEVKGRVVSREDKILLGSTCFLVLSKVLSEAKFRTMLHRRVFDVFDYAINHCSENKCILAQAATLGPQALGSLIFESADFGLTERTLELAFRVGEVVGAEAKDNGVSKARWDSHLFRAAQYGSKDVKTVLAKFRELTMENYESKSPAFLRMLGSRDTRNFQPIFALALEAGGERLQNEDGEVGAGITYGGEVFFNRSTFSAVTTMALEDGSADLVELLLEVEYSTVKRVEIDEDGEKPIVRMKLLKPPTLDSEPLESKKGALEVAFRIRSTDATRLRKIIDARNLSSLSTDHQPKKSTLTTSKGTPRTRTKPQALRHPSPLLLEPLFDPKPSTRPVDRLPKMTKLADKDVNVLSLPKALATTKTLRQAAESTLTENGKRAGSPLALQSASKRVKVVDSATKAKTVLFADDVVNPLPTTSTAPHVLVPDSDPFESQLQVLDLADSDEEDEEASQALQSQLSGMSRTEVLMMLAKANEEEEENPDESREEVDALMLDEVAEEVVEEEDVEMETEEAVEEELAPPIAATGTKLPPRHFLSKPTHHSLRASDPVKSPKKKHKSRNAAPVPEAPTADVDDDFSRLLMELSEVVLQKFASRREDAAQSFDASRSVLDAAALKLGEQFFLETGEIIEHLKGVLDFGAAQTKLLDSVKRLVASSQKVVKASS